MHNHVANRGRKALLKQIFSVFLIFTLYFNFFSSAYASAAEKWTIEEVVYNNVAKSLSYTASRPNAIPANDYVYKGNVGVTAARTGATVATMIRMGLAGAAIIGIVEGVGWVIDNGIVKKYKDNGEINTQFYWASLTSWSSGSPKCKNPSKFSTGQPAIDEFVSCALQNDYINPSCSMNTITEYNCKVTNPSNNGILNHFKIQRFVNQSYDPKTSLVLVSDTELGEKINNSPQAPQVLPDVYNPNNPVGGPAPEATDEVLTNANPVPRSTPTSDINNKPNKDTDGDGKPDTYDPELPSEGTEFKWIEFCSWAATVCDWYGKYKEDSKKTDDHRVKELTFWEKVNEFFDWSKENDSLENEEPEQPQEMELPQFQADAFQATAGCPPDIPIHVSIGTGGNATISYEPICQFAEKWSFVAPLIGFLSGAMILIGVGRKGEDGEI